jgi:photosystem I P700 chlorophyll a apoprotein A2
VDIWQPCSNVAWQGNLLNDQNLPTTRPIACDLGSSLCKAAVEAYTQTEAAGPVNIAYSLVFTIGGTPLVCVFITELFTGAYFCGNASIRSGSVLFAGWLHLQPSFRPSLFLVQER